jgi:hypothetical protein
VTPVSDAADPGVLPSCGSFHITRTKSAQFNCHRRPLGETDRIHRVVCIDEMRFHATGAILPVTISQNGVVADPMRRYVDAGAGENVTGR